MFKSAVTIACLLMLAATVGGQTDTVKYIPKYYDPALEELERLQEAREDSADSVTDAIRDHQEELKDIEKADRKWLTCDFNRVMSPESPQVFESRFHFPPVRQYRTGTCWCFSGTSFLESEVYRLTGRKVRISEMHTVYYEWLEKARRFVKERGESHVWAGSETNGVFRIMKMYGAAPLEVYPGYIGDERHDHAQMTDEIREYLYFAEDEDLWDEELVVESVKLILNKYLGRPPQSFEFEGKSYTPKTFLSDLLKLNLDDYVAVMSTLAFPFYTQQPFDVPDNWWFDSTYYNVPLDEWYVALHEAVRNGYTAAIGGDCSEPGLNGFEDVAFVPDFDIPQEYINQHSREYRMFHEVTTDDHGMHLVGYTEIDGWNWYLLKDSSSRAYCGKFPGYLFLRDDFVRLKMMEFAVHKDAVTDLMKKFMGMGNDLGIE